MTSAQLEQQVIPEPFASESDAVSVISTGTPTNEISFKLGFPVAFSAPHSGGGEYILRGMMNAIGQLASKNEYFRQAGGLYQFNPEWAIANGGYPKNAVLDFLSGNKLYKVLSLVENNMYDYTGTVPTSSQISSGIIQGGVDGIHWMYCNVNQDVKYDDICDVPNFKWPFLSKYSTSLLNSIQDVFPIGYFVAPRDGILTVIGDCDFSLTDYSEAPESSSTFNDEFYSRCGFVIAACSRTYTYKNGTGNEDDKTSIANPRIYYPDLIYSRGDLQTVMLNYENPKPAPPPAPEGTTVPDSYALRAQNISPLHVTNGTAYQLYVVNVGGNVENSSLKVVLI